MDFRSRMKNPWFWVGLIGVILTATGMRPEDFTSWQNVIDAVLTVFGNPFLLGTVFLSILGVFVEPTSKGLTDRKK